MSPDPVRLNARADRQRRSAEHGPEGVHGHPHRHGEARPHRHPHHHALDRARPAASAAAHDHAHTLSFERLTYVCSPVHDLDPRMKIVAALVLVFGVVLAPPMRPPEFAFVCAVLLAGTLLARLPVFAVLARSAIVLPLAGTIALFAPLAQAQGSLSAGSVGAAYASHWGLVWAILSKAWLSAYTMLLLSATTPPPRLFKGLRALRVPSVFTTMLAFLYRYADVLGDQLRSMRLAVDSRGYDVRGIGRARLYGNLAGSLFIRAYERGERVHAAMLSRGFDGTLPTAEELRVTAADALLVATAALTAAAVLLY